MFIRFLFFSILIASIVASIVTWFIPFIKRLGKKAEETYDKLDVKVNPTQETAVHEEEKFNFGN